jgi:hypothetical protein
VALLLGAAGCAGPLASPTPARRFLTDHEHPLGASCVSTADAAAVRCGSAIAAEPLCFAPEGRTCRALAIRYQDGDLVWLYLPPGFDPASPGSFRGPEEKDTLRAFGPSLSWDGRLLWFGVRTLRDRGAVHEYDVQSGELRTVDRNSEWRVSAAEPEHRALPITSPARSLSP